MADIETTLAMTIPLTSITIMQIIFALLVLVVGFFVAKIIVGAFKSGMGNTKLPDLVIEFLSRFLSALLYVLIILLFVGALGVQIGSVILGLSAVIGLILGFGLQDSLTNLAAGVWIASFRPLDVDEVVTVDGHTGKVSAVGMMATELLSFDNKLITIPNKNVWGNAIINATRMPTRRVDVSVGVSYNSKLDIAIQVAMTLMKENKLVLSDPAPAVVTTELADSSVNLKLRAWSKTEDYWTVYGELINGIFKAYREQGVEIPYPQMDVHLKQQ